MAEKNNKLIVRRLVGAILLTIFALAIFIHSQSMVGLAWFGMIRQFQHFLYFDVLWALGIAIWYYITLTKAPNRTAEMIVKISFFVTVAFNGLYCLDLDFSDAGFFAVILMILYAVACPWGKLGYKNQPYSDFNIENPDDKTGRWYKQWWTWLIIILGSLFVSIVFFAVTDGSIVNHASTGSTTQKHDDGYDTLKIDYDDYKVKAVKTYRVNSIDDSWDGGDLKIKKVVVYKLAKPYTYDSSSDGKFKIQGFIRIYMSIKAKDDVTIYPTQGDYSYSNGEQHTADVSDENWDGDINSGVTKSGTVTIPVEKLSSTSSIKFIRAKFDANAQDFDDDSLQKDFDFNINLK